MRHKSRSAAKTTSAAKLHIPEDLLVKSNLSRRETKALNPHLLRDTLFGFRHHGWRKEGTLKVLSNQWRVLAIVGLVAASLTSAPRRPYSPHEKAFYADAQTVEFVRPGLTITVNSAAIAANGTITVTYTLSHLYTDGPQWFASGFGRGDHARHNQPELRCRSASQGPGRLYGLHHA